MSCKNKKWAFPYIKIIKSQLSCYNTPTSLCSGKPKTGCGLVQPKKEPVWGCTLWIKWITELSLEACQKAWSQKRLEGKWKSLASEPRYLPVSSSHLPFLAGCSYIQHINSSSVARQGQKRIYSTKNSRCHWNQPSLHGQPNLSFCQTWVLFLSTLGSTNNTKQLQCDTLSPFQLWTLPLPQEFSGESCKWGPLVSVPLLRLLHMTEFHY